MTRRRSGPRDDLRARGPPPALSKAMGRFNATPFPPMENRGEKPLPPRKRSSGAVAVASRVAEPTHVPAAPAGTDPPPPKPSGPPPEQIERTVRWITSRFRDYYRANPPELPPRFGRREFGFMWIGKQFFLRHRGMRSREDLAAFLASEDRDGKWGTPHHCYYSTAYYRDPNQSTMKEKGWLGADLIFDLDADHLPNAESMTFAEQLAAVKTQARRLLDEFVLGDLGFDADHVRVVFSGGRGYHIHVDDPRVFAMDAAARREVVDHVTARGVALDGLVRERTAAVRKGFQGRREKETFYIVPKPTDAGWAGRFSRGLVATLDALTALPDPRSVVRWAHARGIKGIGEKRAAELIEIARQRDATGRSQIELVAEGSVSNPLLMQIVRIEELAVHGVNEEKGESDEPVTADVKRLIRLPGSLHGKTGFRVTPIEVDALKDFEPLRDAVVFGEDPVRVVVSRPEAVRLAGVDYSCEKGEQELPERFATFLALRRRALVP